MTALKHGWNDFLSDYGMIFVLLGIAACFSAMTWSEQHPDGAQAAEQIAARFRADASGKRTAVIVIRDNPKEEAFAEPLREALAARGVEVAAVIKDTPRQARLAIADLARAGTQIDYFLCNRATSAWGIYDRLREEFPSLRDTQVLRPETYYWPSFLKVNNLVNVANQIAIIAIMAIGMTMVIIAGGIDLSVGSLLALSSVATACLIRDYAGQEDATPLGLVMCSLLGILVAGVVGFYSGLIITQFRVPAFIVTLAMMLIASGLAREWSEDQSIDQIPESYLWLSRGAELGVPNSVVLMVILYLVAHVVMTRTVLGRYVYAVGGNAEAARLSGVPVQRVVWAVYTLSGLLAGLGGVLTASQFKSGSANYGLQYELYVIAAVVVGGTSLSGGKGKIFGTLIGAFVIAVIQNGMNLMGVRSSRQLIMLGVIIVAAVLLDRLRLARRE